MGQVPYRGAMATGSRTPTDYTRAVADEIRAERSRQRLTQGVVAAAAGIPLPTYRKIEQGVRMLDIAQLVDIATALGVTGSVILEAVEQGGRPRPGSGELLPPG